MTFGLGHCNNTNCDTPSVSIKTNDWKLLKGELAFSSAQCWKWRKSLTFLIQEQNDREGETSPVQAAPRDETEELSLNTRTLMQQHSDTVSVQTERVNIGLCSYSWED